MPVPSGNCHCGKIAFYYAAGELFCEDHKSIAVDLARASKFSDVTTERKLAVAGKQMEEDRHRFMFGENSRMTMSMYFWSGDRIHRRQYDRPSYNI